MTVLSYTNAFPGIPFPNHLSGQSKPQSYVYPGAIETVKVPPSILTNTKAFLGISYPNHISTNYKPISYLYPGAVQPIGDTLYPQSIL